ncbi:MAG: cell division protein ZapE [Pseudomonadota bacterium]
MADGPLHRYRALLGSGALRPDAAQRAAIEKLQLLHARLRRRGARTRGVFSVFGFSTMGDAEVAARQGIYLYGGVGRGKSMLMDMFYETAPVEKKRRVHFHAFMQDIHASIGAQRNKHSVKDPIAPVAKAIARSTRLLCFDELQVTDIADAMILGRLFEKLFEEDVVVVATSNRHPNELYKHGLNRPLFEPFIQMIMNRLDIHHLDGAVDFRTQALQGRQVYFSPLGSAADLAMDAAFTELTSGISARALNFAVSGRRVTLARHALGVGRDSFDALCRAPLGPADYLKIATGVRVLMIDRIPRMSRAEANEASRFITLIDALYEARTLLVCSADAPPAELHVDGPRAFEFERTASRLHEMGSEDWIAAATDAEAARER